MAKRLIDYGFHAPTHELPGAGHADGRADRSEIEGGARPLLRRDDRDPRRDSSRSRAASSDREDNPLKHAPHTAAVVIADEWKHAYARETAAYPAAVAAQKKYWPPVGRVDNVYGDRNLFCCCAPIADYE